MWCTPQPAKVQEAGWGARVKGAKAQEAGCGARVKGAGLLDPEPEEGGIVGRRQLQADLAIDHRNGFRVHGEGCEGIEIG